MTDRIQEDHNSRCGPTAVDAGKHQVDVTAQEGSVGPEHCMVCSSPLEYLEQSQSLTCTYCKKTEPGYIRCPHGHYICDTCHNKGAMKTIEDIAYSTTSKDPLAIAELMMSYPGLTMLGCQHAYIAGGALMAALKNEGSRGISNTEIKEVFTRTGKQAHGGYCGLTGVCGIAPAIGACFAVLTGSLCGKDAEQRITMEAVTGVARAITDLTGPSCCKAYVRTSLLSAVKFLKEVSASTLPVNNIPIKCHHTGKHPHGCRESKCPYFEINEGVRIMSSNPMDKYDEFFSMTYQQGTMDVKTKHLVALGASLAGGCQP